PGLLLEGGQHLLEVVLLDAGPLGGDLELHARQVAAARRALAAARGAARHDQQPRRRRGGGAAGPPPVLSHGSPLVAVPLRAPPRCPRRSRGRKSRAARCPPGPAPAAPRGSA